MDQARRVAHATVPYVFAAADVAGLSIIYAALASFFGSSKPVGRLTIQTHRTGDDVFEIRRVRKSSSCTEGATVVKKDGVVTLTHDPDDGEVFIVWRIHAATGERERLLHVFSVQGAGSNTLALQGQAAAQHAVLNGLRKEPPPAAADPNELIRAAVADKFGDRPGRPFTPFKPRCALVGGTRHSHLSDAGVGKQGEASVTRKLRGGEETLWRALFFEPLPEGISGTGPLVPACPAAFPFAVGCRRLVWRNAATGRVLAVGGRGEQELVMEAWEEGRRQQVWHLEAAGATGELYRLRSEASGRWFSCAPLPGAPKRVGSAEAQGEWETVRVVPWD
ncbi:hypothetical protein HYH03_018795 [Edaphochlamys debaryana]|uniref:Ricin B lectin domain-containing protein n=1 Tax=Edaphochlamys debaryana TaxID=47281 RepID=A0A835XD64_9CHLO|nr:hypothetical protein HYH03_018795 [Edaphochlamys debaryana]|eukprot:KAG2482282.1 hypothetical protein HYH03_018795 [Edaphochlamys debaryana]